MFDPLDIFFSISLVMQSNSTSNRICSSSVSSRDYERPPINRQMELITAARTNRSFAPELLMDIIYRGLSYSSAIFGWRRC